MNPEGRRLRRIEAATANEPRGEFTVHVSTVTLAEARRRRNEAEARPPFRRESMTDTEIAVIVPDPPTTGPA